MLTAILLYIFGWGMLHSYIQIVLWKNGRVAKATLKVSSMINDYVAGHITLIQLYKYVLSGDAGWRKELYAMHKFLGILAYLSILFTPLDIIAWIAVCPLYVFMRARYKKALAA